MDAKPWSEADQYKGLKGESKKLSQDFLELLKTSPLPFLRSKTVGKYSVEVDVIPVGKPMTVVSARNWIMMGYAQLKIVYDQPRLLFKLVKKGQGLLMSDSPQEMFLQHDAYKNAKGRVLVGGLGLAGAGFGVSVLESIGEGMQRTGRRRKKKRR